VPWIAADELIYGELGKNLWRGGRLEILGEPQRFYTLVTPLLAGLPLTAFGVSRGYEVLKGLQALVMSLTAIPVFVWARTLASDRWALVAAALTLAVPGLAYSGLIMTEVAFYPVLVLAAWALARALERPTAGRQAVFLGAVVLATLTRLQAAVLVPVFVTALGLKLWFDRSPHGVRPFLPALGGLGLLSVAYLAWQLRHGGPVSNVLGAYRIAGEVSYDAGDVLRFALWHLADLVLLAGFVPAVAVALLATEAGLGREQQPAVRAYVAVAVSLSLWSVAEVAVFASRYVGRLAERNLISLAPVLFVGFACWCSRGAPRPRLATAVAALAAALLLVALPVGRLVTHAAIPDAFMLIPLWRLDVRFPGANLDLLVAVAGAAAAFVVVLVPRRFLPVLAAALLVLLAGISASAGRVVSAQATIQRPTVIADDPRWIDHAAGAPVAYLYDGDEHWNAVWENLFWNDHVDEILDLLQAQVPGPVPQRSVGPRADGTLVDAGGSSPALRYVVASRALRLVGTEVARAQVAQLALWRVDQPPRLVSRLTGIRIQTGDVDAHARLTVYACTGGAAHLSLLAPGPRAVTLRSGPMRRTVEVAAGAHWDGEVPLRPRPGGTCAVDLLVPGGIHVERFEVTRGGPAA
jgi:hypothetical protein